MHIYRDVLDVSSACKGAVVALGNFDGVHLGHRAILRHASEIAKNTGKPLAAMTFEPHPREFLNPQKDKIRIYPFRKKAQLLEEAGIEHLFALRFDKKFSQMSAQDFVAGVLHEALGASHIVTGYNFYFGHGRTGDKEFLAREANRMGFGFYAHPPVVDSAGNPISSSDIRRCLKEGDPAGAAAQLGRSYSISGHVIAGQKRGRTIGFPTANIAVSNLFRPHFGVYAVRAQLQDGSQIYGVANLGIKPTFGEYKPLLETHLFDYSGELYGQRMEVQLISFLREEKKFDNVESLTAQIAKDAQTARERIA